MNRILTVVVSIILGGGLVLCGSSHHLFDIPAVSAQITFQEQPPDATVTLTDPTGDACVTADTTVPDITGLTASKIGNRLQFTFKAVPVITGSLPDIPQGLIWIDADQDRTTGINPYPPEFTRFCPREIDTGVDYMVTWFRDTETSRLIAVVVNVGGPEPFPEVPIVAESGKVTIDVDLSLLGNDDGNIDFIGYMAIPAARCPEPEPRAASGRSGLKRTLALDERCELLGVNVDFIPDTGHGTLTVAALAKTVEELKTVLQSCETELKNAGVFESLLSLLEDAEKFQARGDLDQAIKKVEDFLRKVREFAPATVAASGAGGGSGLISASCAEKLIANGESVLAILKEQACEKFKKSVNTLFGPVDISRGVGEKGKDVSKVIYEFLDKEKKNVLSAVVLDKDTKQQTKLGDDAITIEVFTRGTNDELGKGIRTAESGNASGFAIFSEICGCDKMTCESYVTAWTISIDKRTFSYEGVLLDQCIPVTIDEKAKVSAFSDMPGIKFAYLDLNEFTFVPPAKGGEGKTQGVAIQPKAGDPVVHSFEFTTCLFCKDKLIAVLKWAFKHTITVTNEIGGGTYKVEKGDINLKLADEVAVEECKKLHENTKFRVQDVRVEFVHPSEKKRILLFKNFVEKK